MIPEYFEEIIRNKRFDRTIQGYNPKQVDRYLQKMIFYYSKSCNEKKALEEKIIEYEKQDIHFRKALIRVEETTEEVKEKALKEAREIIEKAQKEADGIKKKSLREAEIIKTNAIDEGDRYIRNLIHNCRLYEDQTNKLVETLYSKVRSKIYNLQEDLSVELKDYIKILENKIQSTHFNKYEYKKFFKQNKNSDRWKQKEEELLVGYEIKKDIKDSKGEIVVPKMTVVTPEILQLLIDKEMYGELFTAIGSEENECII